MEMPLEPLLQEVFRHLHILLSTTLAMVKTKVYYNHNMDKTNLKYNHLLSRSSEIKLKQWWKSHKRKPLILRGARQVGKSTLVRSFAKSMGLTIFEVNLERQQKMSKVFQSMDTAKILTEIEYLCEQGHMLTTGTQFSFSTRYKPFQTLFQRCDILLKTDLSWQL